MNDGDKSVGILGCLCRSPLTIRLNEKLRRHTYLQKDVIEEIQLLVSQLPLLLRVVGDHGHPNGVEIGDRQALHARVARLRQITDFDIGYYIGHLVG